MIGDILLGMIFITGKQFSQQCTSVVNKPFLLRSQICSSALKKMICALMDLGQHDYKVVAGKVGYLEFDGISCTRCGNRGESKRVLEEISKRVFESMVLLCGQFSYGEISTNVIYHAI